MSPIRVMRGEIIAAMSHYLQSRCALCGVHRCGCGARLSWYLRQQAGSQEQ